MNDEREHEYRCDCGWRGDHSSIAVHPRQGFTVCPKCWRRGIERIPTRWEPVRYDDPVAIARAERERAAALAELAELRALINSPTTDDFFAAVRIEAAHQVERWGEHDAGKRAEDWLALFTYLLGKAAKAHFEGNADKLLRHIITVAAVALNWHRNLTGESTRMRPGVGP